MIPNLYKIAGAQLFQALSMLSARALASHALSIFGDHSDVMACRQDPDVQCSAESSAGSNGHSDRMFICQQSKVKFRSSTSFDGFRTSHEIQKIETWRFADLKDMADMEAVRAFSNHALNPDHPCQRGSAQNPDIFFQAQRGM